MMKEIADKKKGHALAQPYYFKRMEIYQSM
jgi:hypothetical protein